MLNMDETHTMGGLMEGVSKALTGKGITKAMATYEVKKNRN